MIVFFCGVCVQCMVYGVLSTMLHTMPPQGHIKRSQFLVRTGYPCVHHTPVHHVWCIGVYMWYVVVSCMLLYLVQIAKLPYTVLRRRLRQYYLYTVRCLVNCVLCTVVLSCSVGYYGCMHTIYKKILVLCMHTFRAYVMTAIVLCVELYWSASEFLLLSIPDPPVHIEPWYCYL